MIYWFFFFFFQLLPLGLTTVDHLPPPHPIPYIHDSFLWYSSFLFAWQFHPKNHLPTFPSSVHIHLNLASFTLSLWYAHFYSWLSGSLPTKISSTISNSFPPLVFLSVGAKIIHNENKSLVWRSSGSALDHLIGGLQKELVYDNSTLKEMF